LLDKQDCFVQFDTRSGLLRLTYDQPSSGGVTWMEDINPMPPSYLRDGFPIEIQGLISYCLRTILDLVPEFTQISDT
jgi:hypothetical protein